MLYHDGLDVTWDRVLNVWDGDRLNTNGICSRCTKGNRGTFARIKSLKRARGDRNVWFMQRNFASVVVRWI